MAKKCSDSEQPKRLSPIGKVTRKLFLLSGNECAYPNCSQVLIDTKGTMIGDVAHICAAEPGGPRFDAQMTNEERRSFDNLLLLCVSHHRQVDGPNSGVTVSDLQKMKSNHEARFSAVEGAIEKRFVEQFKDQTCDTLQTSPHSLDNYEKWLLDAHRNELGESQDQIIKDVSSFVEKLAVAPLNHREFILALIERADRLGEMPDGSVHLRYRDISSALELGIKDIHALVKDLEYYGLGFFHELYDSHDKEEPAVHLSDPSKCLPWSDVYEFCRANDYDLKAFVIDVQFSLLG